MTPFRSEARLRLRRPHAKPIHAWAFPQPQPHGEPPLFRYREIHDGGVTEKTLTGVELQRAFARITAIRETVSKLGVAW